MGGSRTVRLLFPNGGKERQTGGGIVKQIQEKSRFTGRILSYKNVNTARQWELDMARTAMILCLPLIHCINECTDEADLAGGIPYLFDTIIGGPFSAPMYMFAMGVGMVYTKDSNPMHHLMRGLKILLTGYLLNICRFLLPYLAGYALTGEKEKYMEPLLYKLLGNDILIFAGMAMMLMALLIRMEIPDAGLIVIGLGLSGMGTYFNGTDVKSPIGNIFLGYLIGTEDAAGLVVSDFPICNWLLFPFYGYVFGKVLKRVKDKDRFYLLLSAPALVFAVIYFAIGLYKKTGMFGEGQNCYYHMIFGDALASLALTIGRIGVYYYISIQIPEKAVKLCQGISRNITSIYCIHWVLVIVVTNLVLYIAGGTQELEPYRTVLLGCGISAVSVLTAHLYEMWKNKKRRWRRIEKAT